jgi:hypothetical protein
MFMWADFKPRVPENRSGRKQIHSGVVRWQLCSAGRRARLIVQYERRAPKYSATEESHTAVGILGVLSNILPDVDGSDTTVRVAAVPPQWVEAGEFVLEFLASLGAKCTFNGRVLEVRSALAPTEVIRRVGLALLCLDIETRDGLPQTVLDKARLSVVRTFSDEADTCLDLLDENQGRRRIRELLGTSFQHRDSRLAPPTLAAIRRLKPEAVVVFHSGNGKVLEQLTQSVESLRTIIGVEPSLYRLERTRARLKNLFEIHHGSLIELPGELATNAFAIVIDCLPPCGDMRLTKAAETLCGFSGFEWILVLDEQTSSSAFRKICTEQFSYRGGEWNGGGNTVALLLRRAASASAVGANRERKDERQVENPLLKPIRIQKSQWKSTLEAFSLRTVDPRFLVYLPPGLCSLQTNRADGLLEHPADAFSYYQAERVNRVVVETKHMGSRAIAVVVRDKEAALERFGTPELGCIYTRNGRPFFDSSDFLSELREGLTRAKFWEKFETTWACIDGEILPWSVKAQRMIAETHRNKLDASRSVLNEMAAATSFPEGLFLPGIEERRTALGRYENLLDKYDAEIGSAVTFAPFHLIATEGRTFLDKNHIWHMETLNALARRTGRPFVETRFELLDVRDESAVSRVLKWWDELSAAGEEGLVVKPIYFVCRGRRGLAQPGIKCRGREHLRLVYGPDYDLEENRLNLLGRDALARRRQKRRRVIRQFALSIEAAERFVRKEELARVEECVRAILSLETREMFEEERPL